jgi:glutathione S-transferase
MLQSSNPNLYADKTATKLFKGCQLIQLFHSMSARSFRPLWMLEELGQPYELIMLPFPPRTLSRSYLAINPLGTIPFLIDGQTRMSESAAICQYLCTKYAPTQLEVSANEQRLLVLRH